MTVPTRRLGRSNPEGSALGLGGWAIGGAMAAGDQPLGDADGDHAEAHRPLRRFHPLRIRADERACSGEQAPRSPRYRFCFCRSSVERWR
jgi:hypothetical protein